MTAPDFSVVIATYNRSELVKRAVDSVMLAAGDTYRVEVIVIDDASTKPLEPFEHPDVRVVRQSENTGPGPARMRGIEYSAANWVLILDDDDVLLPDACATLSDILKNGAYDAYPVIQFSRSRLKFPFAYKTVTLGDYLDGTISGDFSPLINRRVFFSLNLAYPNNRAGGEHLLWWKIAAREQGFPTFAVPLQRMHDDAAKRLTHAGAQIERAGAHLALALQTEREFGTVLRNQYPRQYSRVLMAKFSYALLSGSKRQARVYCAELPVGSLKKIALITLTFLPGPVVAGLFRLYRSLTS